MVLGIEVAVLCLIMALICVLGTGNDKKNLLSYDSYGDELKALLKKDETLKDKIKVSNPIITFINNFIIFLLILFIFGLFFRTDNFLYNFVSLLILGESANLFDFLIMDALWFTHTKQVRFSAYPDPKLYKSLKYHFYSFLKGTIMFLLVSLIDGAILMTF